MLSAFDSSSVLLRALFLSEELPVDSDGDSSPVPCMVSSPLWRGEAGDVSEFARPLLPALGEAVSLAFGGTVVEGLALGEALTEEFGVTEALGVIDAVVPGESVGAFSALVWV